MHNVVSNSGQLVILVSINKRVYDVNTLVCRLEKRFNLLLQSSTDDTPVREAPF